MEKLVSFFRGALSLIIAFTIAFLIQLLKRYGMAKFSKCLACTKKFVKTINSSKTRIYFLNNVHWNVNNQIVKVFGYQKMKDLEKYLSVPIFH
ncbi:hypothetical protein CR513_54411, partial [Mucuna pruriens]